MNREHNQQRVIQDALRVATHYWQERGDDKFPDQFVTVEDCYRLAEECRAELMQHIIRYGDIGQPLGFRHNEGAR